MFFVTRGLPVVLEIGLFVYCLIDCIQTPQGTTRNLEKVWWLVIIIFVPIVGGIAWLVAGRPQRGSHQVAWPSGTAGYPERERPGRGVGPDDDATFLRNLDWERDLKRREEELKRREDGPQD